MDCKCCSEKAYHTQPDIGNAMAAKTVAEHVRRDLCAPPTRELPVGRDTYHVQINLAAYSGSFETLVASIVQAIRHMLTRSGCQRVDALVACYGERNDIFTVAWTMI